MSFQVRMQKSFFILIVAVLLAGVGNTVSLAQATPILVLTVDGGAIAAVVNDEPVELGWYVDGPVTNCVLIQDNSVSGQTTLATIDTTTLPASGTMDVTPPANSTTNFILNCDGAVDEVPVNVEPPITTLTSDQGTDLVNNPLTGRVNEVILRWNSVNATRCSYITRTSPIIGSVTETSSNDYSNRLGTSGWIRYDGDPRYINETTTFSITCYNDNTGAEHTDTLTITVSNPPPPDPPIVNMWSPDFPVVYRDELYGYAYVDVGFSASNVTSCIERAYYGDGTLYPNPPNWGAGSWVLSRTFTNIQLSTTTIFEVTCSRGDVTIAGIFYPATSTTEQLTIEVQMPGGVDGTVETWDRSALPPVTASITANPNPTTKNALTGYASTITTVNRLNASYCYLSAYRFDAVTGLYTSPYTVSNWNRTLLNNGTTTYAISLATTTRLVADCWRDYDRYNPYATEAEIENAHEVVEYMVYTEEPLEAALPPTLSLYGNAVRATSDGRNQSIDMWTTATERIGFDTRAGTPQYIENSIAATTSSTISFPFVHPHGADDDYDIYLTTCDENDGESTFRVLVSGTLVGQYTTNSPDSPHQYCGSSYGTNVRERVAQNIDINDGDTITIECDTPNDGERCRLVDVLFGAVGLLTTPQVNPVVTSVDVPVLVLAENATFCGSGDYEYGHWAYPATGSRYSWWGAKTHTFLDNTEHTTSMVRVPIATSTRFTLTCWRTGDSLTDYQEFNVYVPFSATLSAQTTVGSGQCIDDGTLGSPFGTAIEAPVGYGPDDDGFCSPMVDLAAMNPSVSLASAIEDNVNGTYDNVNALMVIQNIGPGALPSDSSITYKAVMSIMPAHGLPDVDTSIGTFEGGLSIPANPAVPTQSPTLTRSFGNVPFGTHTICSRVNLDGSPNYPESSTDYTNNVSCSTVTLPVPRPPMIIAADRQLIRPNQTVEISWGVNVTYQLQCVVRGPGGLNESFDTSLVGPGYTDSFTTGPLTSTGIYELRCTEPITNTTFTEQVRIEMVPDIEEI